MRRSGPKVRREDLSDFSQSSFIKILKRDPEVEARIGTRALPLSLVQELYRMFGGTPRFILLIREAIRDMEAETLQMELETVVLPADARPGEL